eukprot:533052_1
MAFCCSSSANGEDPELNETIKMPGSPKDARLDIRVDKDTPTDSAHQRTEWHHSFLGWFSQNWKVISTLSVVLGICWLYYSHHRETTEDIDTKSPSAIHWSNKKLVINNPPGPPPGKNVYTLSLSGKCFRISPLNPYWDKGNPKWTVSFEPGKPFEIDYPFKDWDQVKQLEKVLIHEWDSVDDIPKNHWTFKNAVVRQKLVREIDLSNSLEDWKDA